MRYQKGFSALVTILLVVVVIVGIGAYIWHKTTPTPQIEQISNTVFQANNPEGTSSVVQQVKQKVEEHASQAVLNSLDQQRQAGSDEQAKSNLSSLRSAAELYFDEHSSSFVGLCTANQTGYFPYLDTSNYPDGTHLACNVSSDGQSYAVQANLTTGGYWCVDSSNHLTSGGQSKAESAPLGTRTVCQ